MFNFCNLSNVVKGFKSRILCPDTSNSTKFINDSIPSKVFNLLIPFLPHVSTDKSMRVTNSRSYAPDICFNNLSVNIFLIFCFFEEVFTYCKKQNILNDYYQFDINI